MKDFLNKIAEVKKEVGKLSKDATNPFYKSKYIDINSMLDVIEPALAKHGLLLTQPILDGCVRTVITSIESQDMCTISELKLPELNDPQKIGSAITYYRRYTLQSLLALGAEDDDGNKASQFEKKDLKAEPVKLTDANVANSIKKGTQKQLLKMIGEGSFIATQTQIDKLNG